jgi:hypothetical protein
MKKGAERKGRRCTKMGRKEYYGGRWIGVDKKGAKK